MKRIITLLVAALAISMQSQAQTQQVTFQVENPPSTPVYVFGSWNWGGWPGTAMTSLGNGKYTLTMPLAQSTTHEFLYVSGTTPAKEILSPTAPCTNGNVQYTNRVLPIGTADTAVCYTFATCNTCTITPPPPPPTPVNVTFQVESPDSTPVYVFGSWNWNGWPGTQMTPLGNNKFTATLSLMGGMNHEFLFVNGAAPVKEVLNPSGSCTNGNTQFTNRVLSLGNSDTGICYTFATCNTCTVTPPPPPPAPVNVTFTVESPDSLPVYVFGSWNWGAFPGTQLNSIGNNKYQGTVSLLNNQNYEFLFVNGATPQKEIMNPTASCTNGNTQFTNRTLTLGPIDTTLCFTWQSCNTCTIPPPPANVNVTLQVENPDSTPVYVFGSWNNWNNFPGTQLTLVSGTTYGATISVAPNGNYEYLFVNGTGTKEVLDPLFSCTNGNAQFTNRILNVAASDFTKCNKWESCDTCGQVTPTFVNVKFAVQNPDSTPVYVFGNWNNWSNFPGYPMTFNSALNAYEATVPIVKNSNIEYLYVNGIGTKEVLNPSDPCTNGNAQYTNRVAALSANDTSFCNRWSSCSPCGTSSIASNNALDINMIINKNFVRINSNTINQLDAVEIFDIVGKRVFGISKVLANSDIPVSLDQDILYIIRVKSGDNFYKIKAVIK